MGTNLSHPAPIRQPMFDGRGNLTRPWLLYFIGGGTTAQLVQTINEQISQSGLLSGFSDCNQRDYGPDIEAVSRQLSAVSSPRDRSAEIEEAKLLGDPASARDFSPEIEDLSSRLLTPSFQPRDYDAAIDGLKAESCPLNALGFQQQLDELRLQLASVPTPAPPTAVDTNGALLAANNLDDLDDVATARGNLGLGTAAVDDADAFLQPANNLDDVNDVSTALTNLIGAWQTWVPTLSAGGSMTISSVTVESAQYLKLGPEMHISYRILFTTGGTPSSEVLMTLPLTSAGDDFYGGTVTVFSPDVNWQPGVFLIPSDSLTAQIRLQNAANWSLGSCAIGGSAIYRVS